MKQHFFYPFLLLGFMVLTGCPNNDDDDDQPTPPATQPAIAAGSGPQGASFDLRYADGTEETVSGELVVGWQGGQLLGQNRYRVARIFTDLETFFFRVSMPGEIPSVDALPGTHPLIPFPLLSEDTGSLDMLYPEFYVPGADSDSPFHDSYAEGIIEITRDAEVAGTDYSVLGEVDAVFNSGEDDEVRVSGVFWNIDFTW